MKSRGRRVALWSAVVGIAAVAATGYAFRGRIQEEYWLWKLQNGDVPAQTMAAERLSSLHSRRAVHPLVLLLRQQSKDFPPLSFAGQALASIGKPAVAEVAELLQSPEEMLVYSAFEVLETIGPEANAAIPAIMHATRAENYGIRLHAADCIAAIGSAKEAASALEYLLTDKEPAVVLHAAAAILTVDPDNHSVAIALSALVCDGGGAKDREVAAQLLGRLGHANSVVTKALIRALSDPDTNVRFAATKALAAVKPNPRAVLPELINLLEDEKYDYRGLTAEVIGLFGANAESAVPSLIRALDWDDSDSNIPVTKALVAIGPLALKGLVAALGDKESRTRMLAVRAIGGFGPSAQEHVGRLVAAIKDEDLNVVYRAIEAIGQIGPGAKAAVPALIAYMRQTDIWEGRYLAAKSLGGIGPEAKEAIPLLSECTKDEYEDVAQAATEALRRIRGE